MAQKVRRFKLPEQPDPVLAQEVATKAYVDAMSGGGGFDTVIVKAVDTVRVNNTILDDPELTTPVEASSVYFIEALIFIQSDAAPDFRYGFSVPGDFVSGNMMIGTWAQNLQAATTTIGGVRTVNTAGTITALAVYATLETLSAGTLALQWAQLVTDASNTTVFKGSVMKVKKA